MIDPEALVGSDYPAKANSVIEAVKRSGDGVRIPGERSAQTALQRKETGTLPIPSRIWGSIVKTASKKE